MSENHHNSFNDNSVHGDDAHEIHHALYSTLPRAEQAFQDNLEDQLIASLNRKHSQRDTEDNTMKLFNEKQKRGNSSRLPLTLAAAVIAIAFVGGLLFFIQRASTPSLQQQTNCEFNGRTIPYVIEEGDTLFSVAGAFRTTATRLTVANCLDYDVALSPGDTLYIPISSITDTQECEEICEPVIAVVAVADIAPGTYITEDMLMIVTFMPDEIDMERRIDVIDDIVGRRANTPINQNQPIYSNMIGSYHTPNPFELTATAIVAEASATPGTAVVIAVQNIPEGTVITQEHVTLLTMAEESISSVAFTSIDDVIGKTANREIYAEEVIIASELANCYYDGETFPYTIQPGDTLFGIASDFEVSFIQISDVNCLDDPAILSIGDVLHIPGDSPVQITSTPDAFQLTATAIIDWATEMASTPEAVDSANVPGQIPNPVTVIVASQDIAPGTVITYGMLEYRSMMPEDVDAIFPYCCQNYIVGRTALETIQSGNIIEETMLGITTSTENPHIGIIIGHLGEESPPPAVCDDGLTEGEVNQEIGNLTATQLRQMGYNVEVFGQLDEGVNGFVADLLIEIHAFACTDDSPSGYLAGYNSATPGTEQLETCLTTHYEAATGLTPIRDNYEVPISSSYRVFDVAMTTPAMMLTTASLNADRDLLTENPETIVSGIISTISCFVPLYNSNVATDLVPLVIATRGIELNEIITEDMITVIYVSPEYMNRLQPPLSSFMNVTGSPELVVGQVAAEFLPEFEPVLLENLRSADTCTGECMAVLPQGMVAVMLPTYDDAILHIPLGSRIDVLANVYGSTLAENGMYADSDLVPGQLSYYTSPYFDIERVASNAILLLVDAASDETPYHLITIAVDSQYASSVTNVAEAQFPTMIVPHIPGTDRIERGTHVQQGFQVTDDRLAIIAIPLDQVNTREVINVGDVLDVNFSLPYQYDGTMFEVTPQPGDVFSYSSPNTILQIADTTVLYVGRGNEEYWNPYSENQDELFMAITVNLTEAWLVRWYVDNGASFSLSVDTVATNQSRQEQGFAVAIPISEIETVEYGIVQGDVISLELLNPASTGDVIFENIDVLYIGYDPEEASIMQNLVYLNAGNEEEGFIVIRLDFEQHYRLAELVQDNSTFRITNHQDMTPPIINIGIENTGNIVDEAVHIRNLDDEALGLQGWTLQDEDGNVYEFGEMTIFSNAQHSVRTGTGQDSPLISYWGLQDSVWQAGETIRLYDAEGNLQASYTIAGN